MASNTSKLAQEVLDYSKQIAKLREELNKLKKGTVDYEVAEKKLTEVEKKAKKAKDDLLIATGKLNRENANHKKSVEKSTEALKEYNKTTKDTTGGLSNMATGFLKTIATVGKFFIAYQALNLVISAFKELVIGSVETFVKFQDTLGKVQAVTSATASDMSNISNAIKTTAVETRFTATEIADLSVALGKLGATSQEIPDLLRPISTAAQAVGEDVAAVGEAILKTNNQFGISSKDSVITAAIFADAINTSALSLSSLSTALQYVGPLASQVGLSLADTSAYMKVLADNGFTASKIGTGLRNIFIELKESGKPLIETLKELADENISLSEAVELVGKRSAGQLAVLLENIDIIEKSTSVTRALTQARVAEAAQMKTTAAQADVLKAIYENLQLSLGKSIADNEVLLNSIGALDSGAEQMLRKQIALSQVFSRPGGTEAYERALKKVANNGVKPLTATLDLLAQVGIQSSKKLEKEYNELAIGINRTESEVESLLISLAQTSRNSQEFKEKMVEAFREQGQSFNDATFYAIKYFRSFDDIKEIADGIQGITDALNRDSKAARENDQAQKARQEVIDKYEVSKQRINKLEKEGIDQSKQRNELEKRIKKDRSDEINNLNALKSEYSGLNLQVEQNSRLGILVTLEEKQRLSQLKEQIGLGEARLKQYKVELNDVGTVSDAASEAHELRKREQLERVSESAEEFKDRRANLEDEAKSIKKKYDDEVADAQRLYELRIKGVNDNNEIKKAEEALNKSVAEAEERRLAGIANVYTEIGNIYREAEEARSKFVEEAKAKGFDEEQIEKITEVYDKFKKGTKSLFETLIELETELSKDQFDQVEGPLRQAAASAELFNEKLAALKKQYGDSAAKSKVFQKSQQELRDEQIANLQSIRESLDVTTEAGAAAAAIIDKQIAKTKQAGTAAKETTGLVKSLFKDSFLDAANTALEAIENLNKVSFDNTIKRLEEEKSKIQERADFEENIVKSQLDSQLISQEEYASRLEQIKKKEAQRQNVVDRQIFEEEKKRDKQGATSDYLSALASIIPNLIITEKEADPVKLYIKAAISGALATTAYTSEIAAIDKRKFFGKKFAEGGVVYGPSHEQGGIPFTVQGRGGYEMEGGEYIVNKKAATKYRSLLDQINQTKFQPSYKFATGGPVRVEENVQKQLELLEAIAEATTGTALNTGRPVRAFVSSSDLQNDTSARRIKDRNSNI